MKNERQIKADLKRAEKARRRYLRYVNAPVKPNTNFSPKGKDVPDEVRDGHRIGCMKALQRRNMLRSGGRSK